MRQRRRGFVLVFSLLVLLGLTSLVAAGLTRSLTEVLAGNRFATTQQAFYSAEAGVDWLLWALEPASGCFPGPSGRFDQETLLKGLNKVTQANTPTPISSASFPILPAFCEYTTSVLVNFAACGSNPAPTPVATPEIFPICLQGIATNGVTQSINIVVELPPSEGVTGAMALSKIRLGEITEVKGDVILLSHGDQEGSLKLGKGAKISPAEDGSGGRIFIHDDLVSDYSPAVNLDLSRTGNADNLLPAIRDDDPNSANYGKLEGPVLTGIGQSRHWPIDPHGDDVKGPRMDAFKADLIESNGEWVNASTLREFVKPYITVPDETINIFKKMQVLNNVLTNDEMSSMGRFSRVRTNPNWNNDEQVPPITVTDTGGVQYQDVNNGNWRITQGTGNHATEIRLVKGPIENPDESFYPAGPLPGGVWILKSVDVPKYAPPLTFEDSTRLYLTDRRDSRALNIGEGTSIRVGEAAEPNPDALQIIVPCLGRKDHNNICQRMDEFGVCQDKQDNPDEQECTTQNTATLYLGKGSTVWGSIHAPTTALVLFENVMVKGDHVVSNELKISKGAEFHSPTGFVIPGGGSGKAKKVSIKLWQGR